MATQTRRRPRPKKQRWKRAKKVRARYRKMSRFQRRHETIGGIVMLVGMTAAIAGAFTGGAYEMIGGLAGTLFGAGEVVASRGTPPRDKAGPKQHQTTQGDHDARIFHGRFTETPIDRLRQRFGKQQGAYNGKARVRGRRPCGAACQYSRAPRNTCNCSCGGQLHGTKAPVILNKTNKRRTAAPGKTRPRRKPAPRAKKKP